MPEACQERAQVGDGVNVPFPESPVYRPTGTHLHNQTWAVVAIKVMNPQMAATSPPRKRFLREARSAAAIRHENIVQVYSVEEQPLPDIVMEGKALAEPSQPDASGSAEVSPSKNGAIVRIGAPARGRCP